MLQYMKNRILKNGSCVIVIAEGAGQVIEFKEINNSRYKLNSSVMSNIHLFNISYLQFNMEGILRKYGDHRCVWKPCPQ